MPSCDCKYTVIVSVDNLVAWRLTSKATEQIFELRHRAEAAEKAAQAGYDLEVKAFNEKHLAYLDRLQAGTRKALDYGPHLPDNWDIYSLQRIRNEIDRLHQLARYATAPFAMEEKDVRVLNSIENGMFMQNYVSAIKYLETKYLNKENN